MTNIPINIPDGFNRNPDEYIVWKKKDGTVEIAQNKTHWEKIQNNFCRFFCNLKFLTGSSYKTSEIWETIKNANYSSDDKQKLQEWMKCRLADDMKHGYITGFHDKKILEIKKDIDTPLADGDGSGGSAARVHSAAALIQPSPNPAAQPPETSLIPPPPKAEEPKVDVLHTFLDETDEEGPESDLAPHAASSSVTTTKLDSSEPPLKVLQQVREEGAKGTATKETATDVSHIAIPIMISSLVTEKEGSSEQSQPTGAGKPAPLSGRKATKVPRSKGYLLGGLLFAGAVAGGAYKSGAIGDGSAVLGPLSNGLGMMSNTLHQGAQALYDGSRVFRDWSSHDNEASADSSDRATPSSQRPSAVERMFSRTMNEIVRSSVNEIPVSRYIQIEKTERANPGLGQRQAPYLYDGRLTDVNGVVITPETNDLLIEVLVKKGQDDPVLAETPSIYLPYSFLQNHAQKEIVILYQKARVALKVDDPGEWQRQLDYQVLFRFGPHPSIDRHLQKGQRHELWTGDEAREYLNLMPLEQTIAGEVGMDALMEGPALAPTVARRLEELERISNNDRLEKEDAKQLQASGGKVSSLKMFRDAFAPDTQGVKISMKIVEKNIVDTSPFIALDEHSVSFQKGISVVEGKGDLVCKMDMAGKITDIHLALTDEGILSIQACRDGPFFGSTETFYAACDIRGLADVSKMQQALKENQPPQIAIIDGVATMRFPGANVASS